jgi:seryl-tRNA synthetase
MLDIQLLRKDLASVVARLKARKFDFPAAQFGELEAQRKTVQTRTEDLQAEPRRKARAPMPRWPKRTRFQLN